MALVDVQLETNHLIADSIFSGTESRESFTARCRGKGFAVTICSQSQLVDQVDRYTLNIELTFGVVDFSAGFHRFTQGVDVLAHSGFNLGLTFVQATPGFHIGMHLTILEVSIEDLLSSHDELLFVIDFFIFWNSEIGSPLGVFVGVGLEFVRDLGKMILWEIAVFVSSVQGVRESRGKNKLERDLVLTRWNNATGDIVNWELVFKECFFIFIMLGHCVGFCIFTAAMCFLVLFRPSTFFRPLDFEENSSCRKIGMKIYGDDSSDRVTRSI